MTPTPVRSAIAQRATVGALSTSGHKNRVLSVCRFLGRPRPNGTPRSPIAKNRLLSQALIEVCAKHGILGIRESDAHAVREAGNRVLHMTGQQDELVKLAYEVLKKTMALVSQIHGTSRTRK